MPVYACYKGPNAHLALEHKDAFSLTDAAGRDWLCRQLPGRACGTAADGTPYVRHHPEDLTAEVIRTDCAAHRQGLPSGTTLHVSACAGVEELRASLAEGMPPLA